MGSCGAEIQCSGAEAKIGAYGVAFVRRASGPACSLRLCVGCQLPPTRYLHGCCAVAKARAFRWSERDRPARTLPAAFGASASRHRTTLTCDDQTGGGRVPSHRSRSSSAPRRRSPGTRAGLPAAPARGPSTARAVFCAGLDGAAILSWCAAVQTRNPAEGARPVTPAGQEAPAILRAVPTLVKAHKPAPRGSSLGFPIGVVPKLPFPRGWYTVQRRRNPRRACISGLYQAFGPEGPVPAMAWYRRMVQGPAIFYSSAACGLIRT